jgi:hypothetical protein
VSPPKLNSESCAPAPTFVVAPLAVGSCYLTMGDWLDEPTRLKKTVGRLATYLRATAT